MVNERKKYGAIRTIVAKAHEGDDEFFTPFVNALKNPTSVSKTQVEEDEEYMEEAPE